MDIGRLWVFGYGSLMWNPGFEHERAVIARLNGFARTFCMHSIHHRGTVEHPGLVLALDEQPQSHCDGLGFKVRRGLEDETLTYLRERELISSAYLETSQQIQLLDGDEVTAVTYVVDRDHVQYCGGLPLAEQAETIARAIGGRGHNSDYLFNTTSHLANMGIVDADLEMLSQMVRNIQKSGGV